MAFVGLEAVGDLVLAEVASGILFEVEIVVVETARHTLTSLLTENPRINYEVIHLVSAWRLSAPKMVYVLPLVPP